MAKEREAIEIVEGIVNSYIEADECGLSNNDFKHEIRALQTVLNMLKEKDAEIDKRDNAVRKIINRLDNDINRIAKSKSENNWDDYRRCRLKAYKTKTREIKEYIEEQYFENKVKE